MPAPARGAAGSSTASPSSTGVFTIRSLGPDTPYDVVSSFQSCVAAINTLIAQVAKLQDTIATLSARPLTSAELAQVQGALSATGSNPLNVTGLVGVPTTTP